MITKIGAEAETELRFMTYVDDIGDVMEIERASYPEGSRWSAKDLRDLEQRDSCSTLVYSIDELVVGFCTYRLSPQLRSIENVAVHPRFRGRGIATELVNQVRDYFWADAGAIALTAIVKETNRAAIGLFRECRFRAAGIVREHYADGLDGYLFEISKRPARPQTKGLEKCLY